jgi:hypothetical protein
MVKFCETRFAQSELMVYKNFEKNYNTYRRTWGADEEAVETEFTSSTTVAAATTATTTTAVAAATTSVAAKEEEKEDDDEDDEGPLFNLLQQK